MTKSKQFTHHVLLLVLWRHLVTVGKPVISRTKAKQNAALRNKQDSNIKQMHLFIFSRITEIRWQTKEMTHCWWWIHGLAEFLRHVICIQQQLRLIPWELTTTETDTMKTNNN